MPVIDKFIDYLKAQVGSVYVWGGQGEPVSEEFIKSMKPASETPKGRWHFTASALRREPQTSRLTTVRG